MSNKIQVRVPNHIVVSLGFHCQNRMEYGNLRQLSWARISFSLNISYCYICMYCFINSKSIGLKWYKLTYYITNNVEFDSNFVTHIACVQVIWTIYNYRNKYGINPWFCWKAYHSKDIQLSIYIPFTFFFFRFSRPKKSFPFQ